METHADLKKLKSIALPVGVIGLIASAIGFTQDRDAFSVAWLMGWNFWFYLSLGSLGWLMIYHLTSGRWGFVLQRPFEAAARLMPVMLILFIPILLCMHNLYEWTHEDVIATDAIVQHKLSYLNEKSFTIRLFVYFAVWTVLAYSLSGISRKAGSDGNADAVKKMRTIAAPGLVAFALAATFASFDWLMSLEPHWFSSIYGAVYMVAAGLSTMLFMAMLAYQLSKHEPMKGVITTQQFHDIGNWCFAFTILWTYMNFSQFIIIWSGNLYEETFWYLSRARNGWVGVSILMAVLLFAIPFVLMLFRNNKRNPRILASIAMVVFIARYLEVYWLTAPTFSTRGHAASIHWMDVAAFLGIGGTWLWLFANGLKKAPLLSGDARFTEFAKGGNGAGH
ncbi:MAG TPA: hypothetical protein PJ991_11055 [Kiritimatiellia bacterium]|nr:hypothetical protein [Kiritimatiellia bacterium]